jgi:UDP-N-acetyl-2-amino-2-deoxyglucuronate dehydrogenase
MLKNHAVTWVYSALVQSIAGPPTRFALLGAAGFVAPRHLKAMRDVNGTLMAAMDPCDSVGVLDRYFPDAPFFSDEEAFWQALARDSDPPRYVAVCTPSHLHARQVERALRMGISVMCEKPLALSCAGLDRLERAEGTAGARAHTILQLRMHPAIVELRRKLHEVSPGTPCRVRVTYITPRGPWYDASWKGDHEKSGGIVMNIGVHVLDLLLWLFGPVEAHETHSISRHQAAGELRLERAHVTWLLSIDQRDAPGVIGSAAARACRKLEIDGTVIELSDGFEDLHSEVYRRTLAGGGFRISDARPAIELIERLTGGAKLK